MHVWSEYAVYAYTVVQRDKGVASEDGIRRELFVRGE